MTSPRRFEHDLPALLGDLYVAGPPEYRDDLVRQIARTSQRPAWTFPGRWLPMELVPTRVRTTRLPMRQLGVLALIAILLAAAAAVYVGSQQAPLPAPFGIAGNGVVAYDLGGDILIADPSTGVSTAIVSGPQDDVGPVFSRDGTHLAFARQVAADGRGLYVVRADGSQPVQVTAAPALGLQEYAFSPDGSEILFLAGLEGQRELWIARTDGSGARQLDVGYGVVHPSYLPPDGAEIVFAGAGSIESGNGLYAVDVTAGTVRTILAPEPGVGRDIPRPSPDGSRIAYSAATADPARNTYQVRVVRADGTGDVSIPMPSKAIFQDAPSWSNDGTSLALVRGYAPFNEEMAFATVPADGTGIGVETARGLTGCCDNILEWAPDDSSILVRPIDVDGQGRPELLWDPGTGQTRPASWAALSNPAWQRVAH